MVELALQISNQDYEIPLNIHHNPYPGKHSAWSYDTLLSIYDAVMRGKTRK